MTSVQQSLFPELEPRSTAPEYLRAIEDAVSALLKPLPESDRQRVLRNVATGLSPDPQPRAGQILGTVVNIFERTKKTRAPLAVSDIKRAVAAEGVTATPKALYNALGYLHRRGRIKQLGYGRYMLLDEGVIVEAPGLFEDTSPDGGDD